SRMIVPGTVKYAVSAGTGENGTVPIATNVHMVYHYHVNIAAKKVLIRICWNNNVQDEGVPITTQGS
ncbi:MAG: hypothetical protein R6V01_09240, partial [Thermoplasmatota archaeon]